MRCQPWRRGSQYREENHLDRYTKPAEPVLNHIATYAIYTHEKERQSQ
jgi:hypothetical protein